MLGHMSQRLSKKRWKSLVGMLYVIHRILQTLLLLITTDSFQFDRITCRSSAPIFVEVIQKWVDSWISIQCEEFFRRGIRLLSEKW